MPLTLSGLVTAVEVRNTERHGTYVDVYVAEGRETYHTSGKEDGYTVGETVLLEVAPRVNNWGKIEMRRIKRLGLADSKSAPKAA